MNERRSGHEYDEDLAVVARRQPLGDAERSELDAALAADPTLRIAHEVGRAFDDVAFVRPGDEALIARVVDRTHRSESRPVVARRWRSAAAIAATLLLAAGGAGAYRAGILLRVRRTPAHDIAPTAPRLQARAGMNGHAEAPASVAPAAAGASPATQSATQLKEHAMAWTGPHLGSTRPTRPSSSARPAFATAGPSEQPPTPTPPATASTPDGDVTAADLFRRAGAARRTGALATASALYEDLQARFPAAEEAHLSHVSLGKLLLETGQPQEAEHHFAIYLAGGPGALAAEAAFGRGESFERMGRAREERQAWLELLRDFPESIYAGAARRRIAALDDLGLGPPNPPGDVPAGDSANSR